MDKIIKYYYQGLFKKCTWLICKQGDRSKGEMEDGAWWELLIKDIWAGAKKKKQKKAKRLSEEALQIAEKRGAKGKG